MVQVRSVRNIGTAFFSEELVYEWEFPKRVQAGSYSRSVGDAVLSDGTACSVNAEDRGQNSNRSTAHYIALQSRSVARVQHS